MGKLLLGFIAARAWAKFVDETYTRRRRKKLKTLPAMEVAVEGIFVAVCEVGAMR